MMSMFNYDEIDKTPTVLQVKAIIQYMEDDRHRNYIFENMISMSRPEPNVIFLDLNDANYGITYRVVFDQNSIVSFDKVNAWVS